MEIKIKWIPRKQMTHENTYRDDNVQTRTCDRVAMLQLEICKFLDGDFLSMYLMLFLLFIDVFLLFVSVLNQLHPISIYIVYISVLLVTRIILRPLSALSLDDIAKRYITTGLFGLSY